MVLYCFLAFAPYIDPVIETVANSVKDCKIPAPAGRPASVRNSSTGRRLTGLDMMAFNTGARVSFDSGRDGRLLATLRKFNRKTGTVVTENGQKWNISPHLLSPVKDAKPTQSFNRQRTQRSGAYGSRTG